jgi:hypothetical protein
MLKLTGEQEDKLFKRFRDERKKGFLGLKVPQKEAAKKAVLRMARDKLPAQQSDFTQKGRKQAGLSEGYIATENETGETFMVKHSYKSNQNIPSGSDEEIKQHKKNRQDAVRELLGSTMYQLFLYDRAPKEELVIPDEQNQNSLYVRSKFFTNSITLSQFSGLPPTGHLNSTSKLQALEGFEKVNAACDLLGEIDYHGGNLMVQDNQTITKIDHGKSFTTQFTDFGSMVQAKHKAFSRFEYNKAMKDGNLSFSVEKYSKAINQMLQQYDEQQMEAVIDQKFDELKKAGFDPGGIAVYPIGKQGKYVNSFDELKQFYKDRMKNSITIMRNVAQSTEVISKFSNVPNEFKNGGWLEAFAKSKIQDPVAYAAHHDIQIEGQNALEWAYNNNYKIKIPAKLIKDTTTEEQWQKDASGKWLKKKLVINRDSIKIQGLDPIEYITSAKKQQSFTLSESEKEFLAKAPKLKDSLKKNMTPTPASYGSAPKHAATVKAPSPNPVKAPSPNQRMRAPDPVKVPSPDQVNIEMLVILVDSFTKEAESSTVTTLQVTGFYDTLLSSLEKQGYLTKQDVTNIKKDPDYAQQAEETTKLINAKTLDIERKEKMYYKVARFTKAIGLSTVSEYFTEKITTEKVKKIHAIEKALSHSIKVITISNNSKPDSHTERLARVSSKIQEKLEANKGR